MAIRTFLFIALLFVGGLQGQLPNAPVYPTTTLSASLTPSPSSSNPLTSGHWSETANLKNYRPPVASIVANPPQTDCPHSQGGLKNWNDAGTWGGSGVPANGANVNIPPGTSVLITSIDASHVYGLISIPATSKLIFADAVISIAARGFNVTGGLFAGSETCRLRNKITITLHGTRGQADAPWSKGIAVTGTIDLHGAQYYPTWTRLAMTAKPNDTWIFIQDVVNWEIGQTIVISTTELKDARDWNRNEERIIVDVKRTTLGGGTVSAIQLNTALLYQHFGGREYQAEVALLSRRIVVQGDATNSPPTDTDNAVCKDIAKPGSTYPCVNKYLTGFGAHIMIYNEAAQGRISGVELYRVGQTNVLGRYPIHFHMIGNITQSNYNRAYARDCSVHESYFRCYAIHGTQGVKLTENTAYNAIGHCYFLEDGVEEENIISYNQAAHVHPLGYFMNPSNQEIKNADNFYGQNLEFYKETSTLILPSDMSGACFYITNTYNDIYGNAASGGWTGFAMPSLPLPVKFFRHITNMSPANRPFRSPFRGNSAHSSGYWWQSAGSLYVGGELTHDSQGVLTYTAGRSSTHDTCSDKTAGTPTPGAQAGCYNQNDQKWLRFEDNKVFLSNRGMQNWGNRAEIINLELHDVSLAMNVFGKVWIDNMLMECRSPNNRFTFFSGCTTAPPESNPNWSTCNVRDTTFFESFGGFQWYDVGQQHILTDTTFRNCRPDWNRCAYGNSRTCRNVAVFTSLTHSDQFVPELMQVTSGVRYENVSDLWRYSTSRTSSPFVTVSGRLQSWYDPDGSASQLGSRAMIGSAWANDWWKYNNDCEYYKEAYRCRMAPGDSSASVVLKKYDNDEGQIGKSICFNGAGNCPVIGQVTHFGTTNETNGLAIGVNAKLSGPIIASKGGWFIRYTTGTPKTLTAIGVQVATEDVLLVGIPYPSGTTFNIYHKAASWCGTSWAHCRHSVNPGTSIAAVKAGFGDVYYWDNNNRILYLRLITSKATFGSPSTDNNARWTPFQPEEKFSRGGLTLFTPSHAPSVVIEASCSTNPCAPQNDVRIPNAVPIVVSTTSSTSTTAKATTTSTTSTTAKSSTTTTTSSSSSSSSSSSTTKASTSTTAKASTSTTTAASTAKPSTTTSSSSPSSSPTNVPSSAPTNNPSSNGNNNGNNNGGDGVKESNGNMVVPMVVVLIVCAFFAL